MKAISFALVAAVAALPLAASAQDPEASSPRRQALRAVRGVIEGESSDSKRFLKEHLAARLVSAEGEGELIETLGTIRRALGGAQPDDIFAARREIVILYPGDPDDLVVHVRLDEEDPARIVDLWIEDGPGLDSSADHSAPPPIEPFTWDTLAERMRVEAKAWFAGTALVLREGEVVLDEGYGLADREQQSANRPETIFAIGSTPIDFTKAGILWLAERDQLSLDDPIAKYFEGVPPDKRVMTLRHLFSSRSGLQDFVGVPSDPPNPDHYFIDRAEAVRRILAQELLFAPGEDRAHSHAAWGLLAAVIEIVSGKSYQDFTREHLFGPAGMKDTGFFGEKLPEGRFAVGYGSMTEGEINAPPYWGPTSWLVMGSGGMVSTTHDLLRWMKALRAGKLLKEESLDQYWSPPGAVLAGGDMFGFEIVYTEGPDTLMILTSNAVDGTKRMRWRELARALARLVT